MILKKKYIITILILILGIIVNSGCISNQPAKSNTGSSNEPINNIVEPKTDGELFREVVIGYPNGNVSKGLQVNPEKIHLCKEIINNNTKDMCFARAGSFTKDITLCENIQSNYVKEGICQMHIAYDSGNEKICEIMTDSDLKDSCYNLVAKKNDDINFCQYIDDEQKKNWCIEKKFWQQ
jgi:hypothetical protein